ncbi:Glycosylphosphatidylinositol (GPI) anchor assembly protein [Mycoemilia scoparia]|uniref:Glycosylphosphatidylinositol (GPI) anchor assembly protein n=1 Tax=Mycoemilia scoparia TaxID=417184 RepID=A0A9W8AB88_9FUNG|nr:Glycosylphosphatidylinositol (GPI) anchor assembly protein [Mycoemilia scoparia]
MAEIIDLTTDSDEENNPRVGANSERNEFFADIKPFTADLSLQSKDKAQPVKSKEGLQNTTNPNKSTTSPKATNYIDEYQETADAFLKYCSSHSIDSQSFTDANIKQFIESLLKKPIESNSLTDLEKCKRWIEHLRKLQGIALSHETSNENKPLVTATENIYGTLLTAINKIASGNKQAKQTNIATDMPKVQGVLSLADAINTSKLSMLKPLNPKPSISSEKLGSIKITTESSMLQCKTKQQRLIAPKPLAESPAKPISPSKSTPTKSPKSSSYTNLGLNSILIAPKLSASTPPRISETPVTIASSPITTQPFNKVSPSQPMPNPITTKLTEAPEEPSKPKVLPYSHTRSKDKDSTATPQLPIESATPQKVISPKKPRLPIKSRSPEQQTHSDYEVKDVTTETSDKETKNAVETKSYKKHTAKEHFNDKVDTLCRKAFEKCDGEGDRVRLWTSITKATILPPNITQLIRLKSLWLVRAKSTKAPPHESPSLPADFNIQSLVIHYELEESSRDPLPLLRHSNPILCPMNALATLLFHWRDLRLTNSSKDSLPIDKWTEMPIFPPSDEQSAYYNKQAKLYTHNQDSLFNREWDAVQSTLPKDDQFSYLELIEKRLLSIKLGRRKVVKLHNIDIYVSESQASHFDQLARKRTQGHQKHSSTGPHIAGDSAGNGIAFDPSVLLLLNQRPKTNPTDKAIKRAQVNPPLCIVRKVFPWIQDLLSQVQLPNDGETISEETKGLIRHLDLLRELRVIFLQDAAVILSDPDMADLHYHPAFSHPLFKSQAFYRFRLKMIMTINGYDKARVDLKELREMTKETIDNFVPTLRPESGLENNNDKEGDQGDGATTSAPCIDDGEINGRSDSSVLSQIHRNINNALQRFDMLTTQVIGETADMVTKSKKQIPEGMLPSIPRKKVENHLAQASTSAGEPGCNNLCSESNEPADQCEHIKGLFDLVGQLSDRLDYIEKRVGSDHKNTFVGALIVALLAVTPSAIILKPSPSRWKNTLLLGSLETIPEKWASGLFWPTIVVTWISAYVIPLDWGREWQTWPIPCIMGAIIGHLFGIIFVFIRCWGINLAKQDFKESEAAKRLPFRKHHQE